MDLINFFFAFITRKEKDYKTFSSFLSKTENWKYFESNFKSKVYQIKLEVLIFYSHRYRKQVFQVLKNLLSFPKFKNK